MFVARYVRDEEVIAQAIRATRRGVRDAQRPTGTERARALERLGGVESVADQAAADALDAAEQGMATAMTVDGMRRVVPSITEPPVPGTGWVNGDQWWQYEVVDERNRLTGIYVWNGTSWAAFQFIADSVLVPSSVGSVLLADGAVDAMTIRGAQIFGGYIEAPTIASSDKLGTGANVLNDPSFAGTVNAAWVLSGHSGDAAATVTDSITWDQSFTQDTLMDGPSAIRNWGSGQIDTILTPRSRTTGQLTFANYDWKPSNRTLSNPYTFKASYGWLEYIGWGRNDPSWSAAAEAAKGAGTARTSYLTNTAVAAVAAGERWNVRFTFTTLSEAAAAFVNVFVEVINSSTSAVLWSRELTSIEKQAGQVNDWWESAFTGSVKVRLKAVYTAAGGTITRTNRVGSWAYQSKNGTSFQTWDYSSTEHSTNPATKSIPADTTLRARLNVSAKTALFAKVQPEQGWRLTEDGGFELFNSLGVRTGKLDGEANFLAGVFATAESGARVQATGQAVEYRDALDAVKGQLALNANGLTLQAATGTPLVVDAAEVKAPFGGGLRVIDRATSGEYQGTAAWGYLVFPHGLGAKPKTVLITPMAGGTADDWGARNLRPVFWQATATNIEVRYMREDSREWLLDAAYNNLRVSWVALF